MTEIRAARSDRYGTPEVLYEGTIPMPFRKLLGPKGRMVAMCPDPKRPLSSFLYIFHSTAFGSRRVRFFGAKPKTKQMSSLTSYVESGAIRPLVDTVYPLADIALAHWALEQGGRRGKLIIRLA